MSELLDTSAENISPRGKLSLVEAKKNARDAFLVAISALIPQLLQIAGTVDFGQYELIATVILSAIAPCINRYLNLIRIS